MDRFYHYTAFGEVSVTEGTANTNFRYCGEYYDSETGNYYLRARYYDPVNGRFTTEDPIRDTLNWYTYCANNPVMYSDPSGLIFGTIFDIISLGVSVYDVVKNPDDPWAWIGLAGDAIDLIPVLSGVGESVRGLRVVNTARKTAVNTVQALADADKVIDGMRVAANVSKAPDVGKVTKEIAEATQDVKKGWRVGDDITMPTKAGKDPAWSTVRSRYWKNEALFNKAKYCDDDLERMKKGLAPLVKYDKNGKLYSMELHHIKQRFEGGTHEYSNLEPLTPWDHDAKDKFRHFKP